METENTRTHDETTAPEADMQNTEATAPNPTGKGKLLPEIGAGLLGEILAVALCFVLMLADYDSISYCRGWPGLACLYIYCPALTLLFAIPIVAEAVRLAGKRTGGHGKRKRCYIGTAIVPVFIFILVVSSIILDDYNLLYVPILYVLMGLIAASPVLVLVGAIVGYRKDAK